MATWSQFLDDVMPEVPGASVALAERAIKSAALDFMLRTGLLRKTVSGIDHPGGATPISIAASMGGSEIATRVLGVWFEGKSLPIKSAEELSQDWPDWNTRLGTPEFAVVESLDSLWLSPSPATAQTNKVSIRVIYAYSDVAASIPDTIFGLYSKEIAYGAKSRLLAMPKKPWTDQALAGAYAAIYSGAVDAGATRAGMPGGARLRVTPRGF